MVWLGGGGGRGGEGEMHTSNWLQFGWKRTVLSVMDHFSILLMLSIIMVPIRSVIISGVFSCKRSSQGCTIICIGRRGYHSFQIYFSLLLIIKTNFYNNFEERIGCLIDLLQKTHLVYSYTWKSLTCRRMKQIHPV